MELSGVYEITGSERDIWDVLHSPDRLKNIVPGCTAIDPPRRRALEGDGHTEDRPDEGQLRRIYGI